MSRYSGGIMADFSERIKELRLARGMSQDAVGKVIGVKRYSVCGYEKGKNFPEVPGLMGLADYFGVSTDYLLWAGRITRR
jgi:transcriptional regulator with XRE-family HTH domain